MSNQETEEFVSSLRNSFERFSVKYLIVGYDIISVDNFYSDHRVLRWSRSWRRIRAIFGMRYSRSFSELQNGLAGNKTGDISSVNTK